MKVIGFAAKTVTVQMNYAELNNLAGYTYPAEFREAFNVRIDSSYMDDLRRLTDIDIPISDIFKDAKETINAYATLKTKFESIRNQLKNLLNLMAKLNPEIEARS
jgi:hypothetical protein